MARCFAITFCGRRLAGITALSFAALGMMGCVIIPTETTPIRDIPPEQRGALTVGETTRADVLIRYGEPELRLEGDRILVYHWSRRRAVAILIIPLLPAGVASGMADVDDVEALFLEFDNRGRLTRSGMAVAWQKKTIAEQAAEWAQGGIGPPAPRPAPKTQ